MNDIAKKEHGYHNLMSIDDLWSQIWESASIKVCVPSFKRQYTDCVASTGNNIII
jgi:hypothetical protein